MPFWKRCLVRRLWQLVARLLLLVRVLQPVVGMQGRGRHAQAQMQGSGRQLDVVFMTLVSLLWLRVVEWWVARRSLELEGGLGR